MEDRQNQTLINKLADFQEYVHVACVEYNMIEKQILLQRVTALEADQRTFRPSQTAAVVLKKKLESIRELLRNSADSSNARVMKVLQVIANL